MVVLLEQPYQLKFSCLQFLPRKNSFVLGKQKILSLFYVRVARDALQTIVKVEREDDEHLFLLSMESKKKGGTNLALKFEDDDVPVTRRI